MVNGHDLIQNRILRSLPAAELEPLRARLHYVELSQGTELFSAGEAIGAIHFIDAGTVSIVAALEKGGQAEIGLIGREGFCDVQAALGARTSSCVALVQVAGSSWRMARDAFVSCLADMPVLNRRILDYIDAHLIQLSQTAVCNVLHPIRQRLARRLLMMADRLESDRFPITQQFLSAMLGVHRPGVTLAIRSLERAGLIEHHRGAIRIIDRAGLVASACECHKIVRRRYDALDR